MDCESDRTWQHAAEHDTQPVKIDELPRLNDDVEGLFAIRLLYRENACPAEAEFALHRLLDRSRGMFGAEYVDDIGHTPNQNQPSICPNDAEIARIEKSARKKAREASSS